MLGSETCSTKRSTQPSEARRALSEQARRTNRGLIVGCDAPGRDERGDELLLVHAGPRRCLGNGQPKGSVDSAEPFDRDAKGLGEVRDCATGKLVGSSWNASANSKLSARAPIDDASCWMVNPASRYAAAVTILWTSPRSNGSLDAVVTPIRTSFLDECILDTADCSMSSTRLSVTERSYSRRSRE